MSRIFALSDIHIDIKENRQQMLALSDRDYINDVLIIAGDTTDSLAKLEELFTSLLKKFYRVAFVVGNHELWLRNSHFSDSIEKFEAVQQLCLSLGVEISPFRVEGSSASVWIVPLLSWYRLPEQGENSLYISKQGEDWEKCGWMDKVFCRWPESWKRNGESAADYFLKMNLSFLEKEYDAPILSFSHFLPRKELIFGDVERARLYSTGDPVIPVYPEDPHPLFNFSRVAGCYQLEQQIRTLGSSVHIYGHQHRNRNRLIDGVIYVSHCLGNINEQRYLNYRCEPMLIWDNAFQLTPDDEYILLQS